MSKQSNVGVIGEGRFRQASSTHRINSDAINTDHNHDQPSINTNVCLDLFDPNKLHKPVPRHSPCCSFSPTNELNKTPYECAVDEKKPKENQDFKQFLSKFQNSDAVRSETERATDARESSAERFGDKFEDCSMNVQMFFVKYALTKSNDDTQ